MNKKNVNELINDFEQIDYDEIFPSGFRFNDIFTKILFRNTSITIGISMIFIIIMMALLAPLIAPYSPTLMDSDARLSPPGLEHLFGTDELGRDLFSRILYGARLTFYVGSVAVGIGLVAGMLIGLMAGYSGRMIRNILMRTVDVLYSFPDTLIALALVAFLGPSLTNAMMAIGVSVIPYYARVTYGVVLVEINKPYLDSAVVVGAGMFRQMFKHLLPNIIPPLIVVSTLGFSSAVLSAAGLSFLGLGAQPPAPEWGLILAQGRNYILRAPWILIFPGVAIAFTVLSFNLFGDGIRDLLDPRQQRKL
jgi:peptide/nickel transport system permease protein